MRALAAMHQLEKGDLRLQGEILPEEMELQAADELTHVRQPVMFDVTVQKMEQSILARGSLRTTLDCECARCLKPFKMPLEMGDWTALVSLEGPEKVEIKDDAVDLTPLMREDILLEFPQHPLCESDCGGLPDRLKVKPAKAEGSSAWSELNKLKL